MTYTGPPVSVIGLGRIGSPLAACLGACGLSVVGIDVDKSKVDKLNRHEPPVFEPGLGALLESSAGCVSATTDGAAVAQTAVTFVAVRTPSRRQGEFSLRFVLSACRDVAKGIAAKDDYHLVVLVSTVMPGSTGGRVKAALEEASGRRCGTEFGLCYSPALAALGSVIRDLISPDFVLIGESDARAGDLLCSIYAQLCRADVPVVRTSLVNAEIAKLAINSFVTTKITFANTLARMCERLPGADVDEVTAAIGLDRRIGPKFLKGAISYGGPCFPRDNFAFAALARHIGSPAYLAEATDRANREGISVLADLAISRLPSGGRVGVLGLAYKPDTDVVDDAPGVLLANELDGRGVDVMVHDPVATDAAREILTERVAVASTCRDCVSASDVLVIATPWKQFQQLESDLFDDGRPRLLIDCWRLIDEHRLPGIVEYLPLGCGASPPE